MGCGTSCPLSAVMEIIDRRKWRHGLFTFDEKLLGSLRLSTWLQSKESKMIYRSQCIYDINYCRNGLCFDSDIRGRLRQADASMNHFEMTYENKKGDINHPCSTEDVLSPLFGCRGVVLEVCDVRRTFGADWAVSVTQCWRVVLAIDFRNSRSWKTPASRRVWRHWAGSDVNVSDHAAVWCNQLWPCVNIN